MTELEAECPIPRNLKSGVAVVLQDEAHGAAHRRTRKYTKGPIQVGVVSLSRPARASGQEGLRANEGSRPRFRGAIARSRRDLAICAVAALPAHGAAHR